MKKAFEGGRIDITNGFFPSFRGLDVTICSYSEYPCFYKAFDLVIYDERHSFIERPNSAMLPLAKRAAKERGKFVNITCSPDRERRNLFKAPPEMIEVPVSFTKSPIPEPRIITSRFLEGPEAFIPPMAMDVLKWAMHEDMRTIIFVPDEGKMRDIYDYLTSLEGIERDLIDLSTDRNKTSLMSFKRGECRIIISHDFRDSLHLMEDINVIVMYSHNEIYGVDTLVNMAAMATMHGRKSLAEVVFVALGESEAMSLAKSIIRGVNKIAWEKGYIKR